MKITIVGLGLMGGSLAKALRGWRNAEIAGIDKDINVINQAIADGAIDKYYLADEIVPEEALAGDIVIIALHPRAALDFIEKYGKFAGKKSLWTDIVGVKSTILNYAAKFIPKGVDFIGGHPMAGLEAFGYAHSTAALFKNCNYVLVAPPSVSEKSLELIKEMIFYIGAARITFSDAAKHDTMIAYVSQMPHVLAPAIIAGQNYFASKGFEGGSFHDLTRVGTLDPKLWSELFLLNREPLSQILKDLEENTASLRKLIERAEEPALIEALTRSSSRKKERAEKVSPAKAITKKNE